MADSDIGWEPWLLLLLFVASFFFAGTETALTSLGEVKARQLLDTLGRRGKLLELWIEKPQAVLTSLLIGNNLANIGATALTTRIALDLFGDAALAIVTGLMTLAILIVGEITPKTLARENPEKFAVGALRILRPFYYFFYPLTWVLVHFTSGISRLVGDGKRAPPVTAAEIDYLIGLGSQLGAIDGVKRELLTSVLEFSDLLTKEIMVPRTQVVALDASEPVEDTIAAVEDSEHSRIPVFRENIDTIIGILYVKDLLRFYQRGGADRAGFDLTKMVRPAFFVPEVMKVSRLMTEMQRRRMHMAIVVDEFGGTSGIVTLEDVLEEIVGEIHDEHDAQKDPLQRMSDGKLLAEAGVFLREVEEVLGIEFPEDGDYETLGGFLTATAGQVPPPGSLVAYRGFTFTVRSADDRRVALVEVERSRDTGEFETSGLEREGDFGEDGAGDGSPSGQAEARFYLKVSSN